MRIVKCFQLGIVLSSSAQLLGACSSAGERVIQAEYENRVNEIVAEANSQLIWPKCDGVPGHENCGFIADRFFDPGAYLQMENDYCPGEQGTERCRDAIRGVYTSKLIARFQLANFSLAASECRDKGCPDWKAYEFELMKSHNEAVFARATKDKDLAAEERRRKMSEEGEGARRALLAVALVMQGLGSAMQESSRNHFDGQVGQKRSQTFENARNSCTSDISCGIGYKCIKPEGSLSISGTCARLVDEYGIPTYDYGSSGSRITEVKGCYSSAECSPGFSCEKLDGQYHGVCVK